MNSNPKNKWMVVLGAPNLSDLYWNDRVPDGDQLEDHWLRGQTFSSKRAAEKVAVIERKTSKYLVSVQKYNSRIIMKKTF